MMSNGLLIDRDVLGVDSVLASRTEATRSHRATCTRSRTGGSCSRWSGQPMFKRWCRIVGREELFDDPRFANDDLRAEHSDVLNDLMQEWCADKTQAEAHGVDRGSKAPGGPVGVAPGRARRSRTSRRWATCSACPFRGATHRVPIIETPFRMSKTPGAIRMRAPLLGEHTDEVLTEIGYDPEQVADLRARAIV